eukprot:762744-Hanusia_phi.AAC.2
MPSEKLYANLVSIPSITAGHLISQGNDFPKVMLRRNQKDMKNDEQRSHLASFLPSSTTPSSELSSSTVSYSGETFPTDLRDVSGMSVSPSGRFVAMIRTRDVEGVKEQSLEVWDKHSLILTVSSCGELHGTINVADSFACLCWNKEENMLLYAAEEKKAKASSYWPAKQTRGGEDNERGKEFVFEEDWGELSVGKSRARLFVLHIPSEEAFPIHFLAFSQELSLVGQASGGHSRRRRCGSSGARVPSSPSEFPGSPPHCQVLGFSSLTSFRFQYTTLLRKLDCPPPMPFHLRFAALSSSQTIPRRLGLRFYNTRKSKIGLAMAPFFSAQAARAGASSGQRTSSTTPASSRNPVRWLSCEEDWAARRNGRSMMEQNKGEESRSVLGGIVGPGSREKR